MAISSKPTYDPVGFLPHCFEEFQHGFPVAGARPIIVKPPLMPTSRENIRRGGRFRGDLGEVAAIYVRADMDAPIAAGSSRCLSSQI